MLLRDVLLYTSTSGSVFEKLLTVPETGFPTVLNHSLVVFVLFRSLGVRVYALREVEVLITVCSEIFPGG